MALSVYVGFAKMIVPHTLGDKIAQETGTRTISVTDDVSQ